MDKIIWFLWKNRLELEYPQNFDVFRATRQELKTIFEK